LANNKYFYYFSFIFLVSCGDFSSFNRSLSSFINDDNNSSNNNIPLNNNEIEDGINTGSQLNDDSNSSSDQDGSSNDSNGNLLSGNDSNDNSSSSDLESPYGESSFDPISHDEAEAIDYEGDHLTIPNCEPKVGTLGNGGVYTVGMDGFYGDEHTTRPKTDVHPGIGEASTAAGDNPEFFRFNVARASGSKTSTSLQTNFSGGWYSSAHQNAGEPSPSDEQYVAYLPPIQDLGIGYYEITISYRRTENRTKSYPAVYQIWTMTPEGEDYFVEETYTQYEEDSSGEAITDPFGTFTEKTLTFTPFMCANSFLKVVDPGTGSISFGPAKFKFLGKTKP